MPATDSMLMFIVFSLDENEALKSRVGPHVTFVVQFHEKPDPMALSSSKPIMVSVPKNFDALRIAGQYKSTSSSIQLMADRLNWFVHQLVIAPLRQDIRKELEETGFVRLSTKVFDEVYRSRTTTEEVINILDGSVIEREHSYQTNQYSKGHRLTPEFSGETIRVELVSAQMRRYVSAFFKYNEKKRVESLTGIEPLVKFIRSPDLKIDLTKAHGFLEFWVLDLQEKIQAARTQLGNDVANELNQRAHAKIYHQKELIRRIEKGDLYPNRDETGMRLHSAYTGLKSPLRNYLSYRGQNLVSVDLKASQPYLLSRLLQSEFWSEKDENNANEYTIGRIYPELWSRLSRSSSLKTIIMFTDPAETLSGKGLRGNSFFDLPWKNDFYQLLTDQVGTDFTNNKSVRYYYKDRSKTKRAMMLLFFEPRFVGKETYRVPFETCFPGVLKLMDAVRRTKGLPKKRKGKIIAEPKNNNLPILLQRLEASLIIDEICSAISKDHPGLFLLTIHDSIITVEGKEGIVVDYMNRILEKRIGIAPGLKTELLCDSGDKSVWDAFIQKEWDEMLAGVKQRKKQTGNAVSNGTTQKMLESASVYGEIPLVWNRLPMHNGRIRLSTKYFQGETFFDEE